MTARTDWRSLAERLTSFFLAPSSPRALAILRIGIALVMLAQAWTLSHHLLELFGHLGLVQWTIADVVASRWLPRIGHLASVLQAYGVNQDGSVYFVYLVYVASLVGLLFGLRTRTCAVVAWLTHAALMNSGNLSAYGVEAFAHIGLFYCMVMPVGAAFSLDRRAGRTSDAPSWTATLSLRVLQLHMCVVYLATGVEKARGIQWWNGEAIWRAVMQPQFSQMELSWLAGVPWLAALATWGTLVVEIGYAFFIWPRRTRALWVGATIGLHLGIGVFLGLWLFAAMMCVLTFAAFGWNLLAEGRHPWLRVLTQREAAVPTPEEAPLPASKLTL